MATAGDEKVHHVSGGAGEKRPFESENSTGIMSSDKCESCATTGVSISSEIEQKWKQMRFTTRCKIQLPATMENLPDEILLNIFVRLLAKQLAQMRSVSKSWKALLFQPSFIKSHLHRSIRNNNDQILLVFPDCEDRYKLCTQYSSQSPSLEPINFIKQTPAELPLRVVGSVNGLICLSSGYSYFPIYIWNPSLSAVSTVPWTPSMLRPVSHFETSIRFGFDPKTNDYKVVKLTSFGLIPSFREWLPVEVYSMRKGSWDLITQPFPSHIKRVHWNDYLCVDGHHGYLHWNTGGVWKTEGTIVAFDLGSDTFHEIPLPDVVRHSNHMHHSLGVLGGKLCVMSRHPGHAWELWVMEEYRVPKSWVKRHDFFPQIIGVQTLLLGFTSRNELVYQDKNRRLVLCDPVNKTKMSHPNKSTSRIVEYVDSLVWV